MLTLLCPKITWLFVTWPLDSLWLVCLISQYQAAAFSYLLLGTCMCKDIKTLPLMGFFLFGGGGWRVAATVTVHKTPRMLTYTQKPSLILPDHMATMRTQIHHSSTACHEASTAPWPRISIPAYQHPSTQDLHRHCISIPAHISTQQQTTLFGYTAFV